MFWFIALLLLAGAGFYFYQKMIAIEKEIIAEQTADQVVEEAPVVSEPEVLISQEEAAVATDEEAASPDIVADDPMVVPAVDKMTSKVVPVADAASSLEDEIIAAVANLPGVKQSELYNSFADVNKKQLQTLLKELADNGKIKREKKGCSYELFPV